MGSASAAVPESASLLLLAIAATCFARRTCRPRYRGALHVHISVNLADDPSVKLNA
jgi:hypothetical protein